MFWKKNKKKLSTERFGRFRNYKYDFKSLRRKINKVNSN